jgi:large subunit ribosomal protein L27
MATKKAGGSAKNLRDSQPKYLGVKLYAGEKASAGAIIIRQRGTDVLPGKNVQMGRDHTIYAVKEGIVKFGKKRAVSFDNTTKTKKVVHVE